VNPLAVPLVPAESPSFAGMVTFVGAGPGAADLLTLRALERLRRADVVVHDRLVTEAVLTSIPAAVERIEIDRGDHGEHDPGGTTGELLARLAAAGRAVVRLKGGDPTVFARLAEELAPLRRAAIPVEIVPGVTAACAAAAAAVVPLTSRIEASCLTLIAGHEARGKAAPVDFRPLAALPGTLAVYMGIEQLAGWSQDLIAAGRPADTPVTLVSRCSWPDERQATSTLGSCASDAVRDGWRSPAVMIVGPVVAAAATGPLAGRAVIVTRPAGQQAELVARIRAAGGSPLAAPVITIGPPASWDPLDEALHRLDTYDWIVFASVNGVRGFLDRLRHVGRDGRALGTARLAAIGPATRARLEAAGFLCDLSPADHRSEGLVEAFAGQRRGGRFLLVRAAAGRDLLRRELEARGHEVDEVAAYASEPVAAVEPAVAERLPGPGAWITVTSGAIVEAAVRLFGERLRGWRIASLSPVTSATLRRFGLEPAAEAAAATAASLVEAICGSVGGVGIESGAVQPVQPSGSQLAGRDAGRAP
jgi:uroporphyrinogen III methyltransferase/synthase